MDTEALRTFLAIHDHGGISSAADRLHRSQPAISRRIALLEGQLGVTLFERVAGGVVLSEAGQALLPYAKLVMAALMDCRAVVADLRSGMAGPLSLAVVGTLAGADLTRALKQFTAEHPRVDIRLRTANSSEVSDLVRSGDVAIGLRYHRDRAPELRCVELSAERLQIVCWPSHPLAGSPVRSLKRLAGERWLAFPVTARTIETAVEAFFARLSAAGGMQVDRVPVDSLTAQKRLVEAGYGLAVLPDGAIQEEIRAGTLAKVQVSGVKLANPVCLVTRREGYLSPMALALIALLRGKGATR
jgi:DNA-binding transcriptional LysR family regulator